MGNKSRKLLIECKLICLEMKMDNYITIARLSSSKEEINEAVNRFQECYKRHTDLFYELLDI